MEKRATYEENKEIWINALQRMIDRIRTSSDGELDVRMNFMHNPIELSEPGAERQVWIEGRRQWLFFIREMHQERDLILKRQNG